MSIMPTMSKEYAQQWASLNRDKKNASQKKYKETLRLWLQEEKSKPCVDCDIQYPSYVMDFDHRPGEVKEFAICKSWKSKSKGQIQREIDKCDVVCANCHRERTWSRFQTDLI